jgi:parvulin-like peptidyl-prolyl isomerase
MKKKIILIVILFVFFAAAFFTVTGLGIYKYHWENEFTKKIVKIIPYPAAYASGKIITYDSWQEKIKQYENNKKLYLTEQEVDLSSLPMPNGEEIKQKALDDLIKRALLYKFAKKNGIKVSNNEINTGYHDLILANIKNGEESAEESLQEMYGLSIEEFKDQVIKDYLIRKKITEKLSTEPDNVLNTLAGDEAKIILDQLNSGGEFSDLARQYSDDSTALEGGDMGYIGRGEMVSFYEDAAWALEKDEISDLIKTPIDYSPSGYYIVKLEDKRVLEGEEEIKIRHIFIKADIDAWIEQQMAQAKVLRFVK